jgi:sigma-E factor negative regulatory protein RseC
MLEQSAEVLEVAPEGAWVRAVESSGCGTCGGHGCATRRIAEVFQRTPRGFLVNSSLPLVRGDRVVVGIEDGSVLSGALRAYGVPLALMLAGALIAQAIRPGDGPAIAGLVAGGIAGWLAGRRGGPGRPVVLRHEGPVPIQLKSCK